MNEHPPHSGRRTQRRGSGQPGSRLARNLLFAGMALLWLGVALIPISLGFKAAAFGTESPLQAVPALVWLLIVAGAAVISTGIVLVRRKRQ